MATGRKLLNLLFHLFCAQSTLAQNPYGTGCPCQRPFGNQNPIVNFQPPRPPPNYIQNAPINYAITQRPANELAILGNLPVIGNQGINYPINQRTINELAILSNLPVINNPGINYPINQRPINELAILSNLPLINGNQGINRMPYNLPPVNLPPNYNNIAILNQIKSLPFNALPISNNLPVGLINSLPVNNQIIRGNGPPLNQFNYLPTNNIPIKNVPVVNQLNNLPINMPNLPIANGLQFANLPIINALPIPNLRPNNIPISNNLPPAFNAFPANNNLPINIAQLVNTNPIVNNLPLPNNLPLGNNLPIVNNQQAVFIPNRYQILNNPPAANPLASGINLNQGNFNVFAANNIPISQPNNVLPNLPVSNNVRYIRDVPHPQANIPKLPVTNDCNCKKSGLAMLLEKEFANTLSDPVVSLNGLQLGGVGGLGNLPLFNGLPVIGMTESVVNLDSCNCQN